MYRSAYGIFAPESFLERLRDSPDGHNQSPPLHRWEKIRSWVSLDADTGAIVTTMPIGECVDATSYEPLSHLIFFSNGDGTVTLRQAIQTSNAAVSNHALSCLPPSPTGQG